MPIVVSALVGSPGFPAISGDAFHTQVQPRVLDLTTRMTPVTRPFLPEKIEPKWNGVIAGVPLSLSGSKERGGFRIDLEIKW